MAMPISRYSVNLTSPKVLLPAFILGGIFLFFVTGIFSVTSDRQINLQQPQHADLKDSSVAEFDSLLGLLSEDSDFPSNVNRLEQEDPLLHKYILFRHLTPPSKQPYNVGSPPPHRNYYSQHVANLFKNKWGGTFIEAGAYDGLAASNTIYLEESLGWKGLLVECNPVSIPLLKLKQRKAWIADVCLAETNYPAVVNFSNPITWAPSAKIGSPRDLSKWGVKTDWKQFQVTAMPLFALLSAINLKQIDFFSLDIEGAEFEVLKSIPWDKVTISALFVEVDHFSPDKKAQVRSFIESKGYKLERDFQSDLLYVHSSFQPS